MADKNLKGKDLYEARKKWAHHLVEAMKTALHYEIDITTGKFTTTADGFDIHIVKSDADKVEKYLENEKIEFAHGTNGNYTIIYPENLWEEKIDPKDVKKVIEYQRDRMIRYLGNHNLTYKGRGKAKNGAYITNRMKEILKDNTITFTATNETAAKQVSVFLHKMYKLGAGLVPGIEIAISGVFVKVKFYKEFFPKVEVTNEIQPPLVNEEREIEKTLVLGDAEKAMETLAGLRKNIFSIYSPEVAAALEFVFAQNGLKVIQCSEEGPAGNKSLVTRTLTQSDLTTLVVTPFIEKMKE